MQIEQREEIAASVARHYIRRGCTWADPAEMRQEAHVTIAEALARPNVRQEDAAGYAYTAAHRTVGEWLWRRSKPVTGAQRNLRALANIQMQTLDDHDETTDDLEAKLSDQQWRSRVRSELRRIVSGRSDMEQALRVLLGEATMAEVSTEKRIPLKPFIAKVMALKAELAGHEALRGLYGELEE